MSIRLVAFDLDDTLADSRAPIAPAMANALARLLDLVPVAIISGGHFPQFAKQILAYLPAGANLKNLNLLPTCGTRFLRYEDGDWLQVYAHDLTDDEKRRVTASIRKRATELGLWEPDQLVRGERIEDRGSQVTYSALGQQARLEDKRAWDPDGSKRHALRDAVAVDVPDLAVAAGGSTSIDITRQGVDKAYGIRSLSAQTGIALSEMLFIGDRLEPGGNDYPVVQLGVATIAVAGWRDTLAHVSDLCDRLEG